MKDKSRAQPRFFTVEEANRRLPLVRAIVTDMSELARDLLDRKQRVESLMAGRKPSARDAYSEELAEVYKAIDRDTNRLNEFVEELNSLGVEAKGATEGLVDFPALIEGRQVCLCWKLGEPEVLYWHEIDAGYAGRHPLPSLAENETQTSA